MGDETHLALVGVVLAVVVAVQESALPVLLLLLLQAL